MILQSEISSISEKEGVTPDTVDKNWVLGHFLAELFCSEWAQKYLIFKGGTCLKKCYFKHYRFSEDLDFTLLKPDFMVTEDLIRFVCSRITSRVGILFSPVKINPKISDNKNVGYESIVRFWGANHKRNQQPTPDKRWTTSMKIDIISYEKVVDTPNHRILLDDFSDSVHFKGVTIPCYSIEEIVAEKFRALLQRNYSAPRDYYDLWYILKLNIVDLDKMLKMFRLKLDYKRLPWGGYRNFFEANKIASVTHAWANSLQGHIRYSELPDAKTILSELEAVCEKIIWL